MDWRSVRPATTIRQSGTASDKKGMERTVPNATHRSVREDTLFVEISPMACLLNQRRWKAMRIGLVMGQLVIHKIIDLQMKVLCKAESLC
jgi:hypothetical protein